MIGLVQGLREANTRGERLGLSEDERAFYDVLEANDSAVQVVGRRRGIAREFVDTNRRDITTDWTTPKSVCAHLRVLVRRIPRKHSPPRQTRRRSS